jgi:sugar phosphate isomerase/epimerase
VGHGTMPWPEIRAALAEQGIDHWVVEHDNPADHARFARRSLDTLKGW